MTGGRSCHLSLEGERRLPKEEGEVGTMSIPGCMVFVQSFVIHLSSTSCVPDPVFIEGIGG